MTKSVSKKRHLCLKAIFRKSFISFFSLFLFFSVFECDIIECSPSEVENRASLQIYVEKFLKTMFTYSVPEDIENFEESERYMVEDTKKAWREWYKKWLVNAGHTRSSSKISLGQIIINPKVGTKGEVGARVQVITTTSIFGKGYESYGEIHVILIPTEIIVGTKQKTVLGIAYIKHASDNGGVFELSPYGVKVKPGLSEDQFNRMVLEMGS